MARERVPGSKAGSGRRGLGPVKTPQESEPLVGTPEIVASELAEMDAAITTPEASNEPRKRAPRKSASEKSDKVATSISKRNRSVNQNVKQGDKSINFQTGDNVNIQGGVGNRTTIIGMPSMTTTAPMTGLSVDPTIPGPSVTVPAIEPTNPPSNKKGAGSAPTNPEPASVATAAAQSADPSQTAVTPPPAAAQAPAQPADPGTPVTAGGRHRDMREEDVVEVAKKGKEPATPAELREAYRKWMEGNGSTLGTKNKEVTKDAALKETEPPNEEDIHAATVAFGNNPSASYGPELNDQIAATKNAAPGKNSAPQAQTSGEYYQEQITSQEMATLRSRLALAQEEVSKHKSLWRTAVRGATGKLVLNAPFENAKKGLEVAREAWAAKASDIAAKSFEMAQQELTTALAAKRAEMFAPENLLKEGRAVFSAKFPDAKAWPADESFFRALGEQAVETQYEILEKDRVLALNGSRAHLGTEGVLADLQLIANERSRLAQERLNSSPAVKKALVKGLAWYKKQPWYTKAALGLGVPVAGAAGVAALITSAAPGAAAIAAFGGVSASKLVGKAHEQYAKRTAAKRDRKINAERAARAQALTAEDAGKPFDLKKQREALVTEILTGEKTEDALRREARIKGVLQAAAGAGVGIGTYMSLSDISFLGGAPRTLPKGVAPLTEPPSGTFPGLESGGKSGAAPLTEPPSGSMPGLESGGKSGVAPLTEPPSGSLRDDSIYTGELPTTVPKPLDTVRVIPGAGTEAGAGATTPIDKLTPGVGGEASGIPGAPATPSSPDYMPLDPSDRAFPNESMREGAGIAPPAEPEVPTNPSVTEPEVLDPEKMPSTSSIDHRIDLESRNGATFGEKYIVKEGDNTWDIISRKLQDAGQLDGLNKREANALIKGYENRLTELGPKRLQELGFPEGKLGRIYPGDQLDLHILDNDPLQAPKISTTPAATTGTPRPRAVDTGAYTPETAVTYAPTQAEIRAEFDSMVNDNFGRKGIFKFLDGLGVKNPAFRRFNTYVDWHTPSQFLEKGAGPSNGFFGLDQQDILRIKELLREGQSYGLDMKKYTTMHDALTDIAAKRLSGGRS